MIGDKIRKLIEYPARKKIRDQGFRIKYLEGVLDYLVADDDNYWLYKNRTERMDANQTIFEEMRRSFHLQRYRFACGYVQDKIVTDVACGTGYGSHILKLEGLAKSVTGMDIDEEAIGYATRKYSVDGVGFKVASADNTGEQASSYDAIISFETIEHVPDDEALIEEYFRLLKPAGLLICSTPNNWPVDISEHHLRTYDLNALTRLIEKKFIINKVYNQNSGSNYYYNHNQPAGIVETVEDNSEFAECFILVCQRK